MFVGKGTLGDVLSTHFEMGAYESCPTQTDLSLSMHVMCQNNFKPGIAQKMTKHQSPLLLEPGSFMKSEERPLDSAGSLEVLRRTPTHSPFPKRTGHRYGWPLGTSITWDATRMNETTQEANRAVSTPNGPRYHVCDLLGSNDVLQAPQWPEEHFDAWPATPLRLGGRPSEAGEARGRRGKGRSDTVLEGL